MKKDLRTSSWLWGFVAAVGTAVGCATPDNTQSSYAPSSAADAGPLSAADAGTPLAGECQPGAQDACTCDGGVASSRSCVGDGTWGECYCYAQSASDAGAAMPGDCLPGRYEGEFFGYYYSQYLFGLTAIPVWAWSVDGTPGMAFTLNAKEVIKGRTNWPTKP